MEYKRVPRSIAFKAIAEKVTENTELVLNESKSKGILPREAAVRFATKQFKEGDEFQTLVDLLGGGQMYRIRFHGRGGQGMKTASRILGTAFFIEGFEVQDAPLYGAERRGAPVFAYVRAGREAINERGVIRRPDLVVVADDTLVPVPVAGVMRGVTRDTVLLINSDVEPDRWKERLNFAGTVVTLPGLR